MQSVIMKMGVEDEEERRNGPSLASDDLKKKKKRSQPCPAEQGASTRQREFWVQVGENAGFPASLQSSTQPPRNQRSTIAFCSCS